MKRHFGGFQSDARNLGGRTQIEEHMQNHVYNLYNVKAVVRITPPHPHVDKGRMRKTLTQGNKRNTSFIGVMRGRDYAMVRATYRTISGLKKGAIDRSEPKTFGLIEKLSINKKTNNFGLTEHIKNMSSLQRKIERIDSANVYMTSL